MGVYLFKAASHYCNSYNDYLYNLTRQSAYSRQYHEQGASSRMRCDCIKCRSGKSRRSDRKSSKNSEDGPSIVEITGEEEEAMSNGSKSPKSDASFDQINSSFAKDLKAAAEADAKNPHSKPATTSVMDTSVPPLTTGPSSRSSNYSSQNLNSSPLINSSKTQESTGYSVPNEAISNRSSSAADLEHKESIYTNVSVASEEVQTEASNFIFVKDTSVKNNSIIQSSVEPHATSVTNFTNNSPNETSSTSKPSTTSSFQLFDDPTFSNFFSDLKPKSSNGNSKADFSLFDFSLGSKAGTPSTTVAQPPTRVQPIVLAQQQASEPISIASKSSEFSARSSEPKVEHFLSLLDDDDPFAPGPKQSKTYPTINDFLVPPMISTSSRKPDPKDEIEESMFDPPKAKPFDLSKITLENGCVFCSTRGHQSAGCTQYRSTVDRLTRAEELGRCMKCLELGHTKLHCPQVDKLSCEVCGLAHLALVYHCEGRF